MVILSIKILIGLILSSTGSNYHNTVLELYLFRAGSQSAFKVANKSFYVLKFCICIDGNIFMFLHTLLKAFQICTDVRLIECAPQIFEISSELLLALNEGNLKSLFGNSQRRRHTG